MYAKGGGCLFYLHFISREFEPNVHVRYDEVGQGWQISSQQAQKVNFGGSRWFLNKGSYKKIKIKLTKIV